MKLIFFIKAWIFKQFFLNKEWLKRQFVWILFKFPKFLDVPLIKLWFFKKLNSQVLFINYLIDFSPHQLYDIISYNDNHTKQNTVLKYLRKETKPGKILAIFFSGRSGSFFLHSFFHKPNLERCFSLPPHYFMALEIIILTTDIKKFNSSRTTGCKKISSEVLDISEKILYHVRQYKNDQQQNIQKQREILDNIEYGRFCLTLIFQIAHLSELTYERLIKIMALSFEIAKCKVFNPKYEDEFIFVWQAHVPLWDQATQWPSNIEYLPRREWLNKHVLNLMTITVVRFPEKALDSHLIHHMASGENPSPPFETLLQRLILDSGMALGNDLSVDADKSKHGAVRFEDLQENTHLVLTKICDFLSIEYDKKMLNSQIDKEKLNSDFDQLYQRHNLKDTRKLLMHDYSCNFLSKEDIILVRKLLVKNYIQWGYVDVVETYFKFQIPSHINDLKYEVVFPAQLKLTDNLDDKIIMEESRANLTAAFALEISRREKDVYIIPLLYDPPRLILTNSNEI